MDRVEHLFNDSSKENNALSLNTFVDYVAGPNMRSSYSTLEPISSSGSSNPSVTLHLTSPSGPSIESSAQMGPTYDPLNNIPSSSSSAQYSILSTPHLSSFLPPSYQTDIASFPSYYLSGTTYSSSSFHPSGSSFDPSAQTESFYHPRDLSSVHRGASFRQPLCSSATHNSRPYPDPRALHTGHPSDATHGLAPPPASLYTPQMQFSDSPFETHFATRQTALYDESTVASATTSSRRPILSTPFFTTTPYTPPSNDASTSRIPNNGNPEWNSQEKNQGTKEDKASNLRLEGEIKRVEDTMRKNIIEGYCARPEAVDWAKNAKTRLTECLSQVGSLGTRLHSEDLQEKEDLIEKLRLLAQMQQALGVLPADSSHQHLSTLKHLSSPPVEPHNAFAPYHAATPYPVLESSPLLPVESSHILTALPTAPHASLSGNNEIPKDFVLVANTDILDHAASSSVTPEDSESFGRFIDWSIYNDPWSNNVAAFVPYDLSPPTPAPVSPPVAHTAHTVSSPIASTSSRSAPSVPPVTTRKTLSSDERKKNALEADKIRSRTRRSERSTEGKRLISLLAEQQDMGVFQPIGTKWIRSQLDAVRECVPHMERMKECLRQHEIRKERHVQDMKQLLSRLHEIERKNAKHKEVFSYEIAGSSHPPVGGTPVSNGPESTNGGPIRNQRGSSSNTTPFNPYSTSHSRRDSGPRMTRKP